VRCQLGKNDRGLFVIIGEFCKVFVGDHETRLVLLQELLNWLV
jgi:hypothetical protein